MTKTWNDDSNNNDHNMARLEEKEVLPASLQRLTPPSLRRSMPNSYRNLRRWAFLPTSPGDVGLLTLVYAMLYLRMALHSWTKTAPIQMTKMTW